MPRTHANIRIMAMNIQHYFTTSGKDAETLLSVNYRISNEYIVMNFAATLLVGEVFSHEY